MESKNGFITSVCSCAIFLVKSSLCPIWQHNVASLCISFAMATRPAVSFSMASDLLTPSATFLALFNRIEGNLYQGLHNCESTLKGEFYLKLNKNNKVAE